MLIQQRAIDLARDGLLFVSRPIVCRCKAHVFCIRPGPDMPWLCPLCGETFDKDFQVDLNTMDIYDIEHGMSADLTPDQMSGRWQVNDPEELVLMVSHNACPGCGRCPQRCGCS